MARPARLRSTDPSRASSCAPIATLVFAAWIAGCTRSDALANRVHREPVGGRSIPRSAHHVPEGCHAVVHVDFAGAGGAQRLFGLLPGITGSWLHERALALGAIDIDHDVSHGLVCYRVGSDGIKTAIVAAGTIPDGAVAPGIQATDPDAVLVPLAGREVAAFFVEGRRWFAGQASDGTIVVGDDAHLVGSALLPSDRGSTLWLAWDAPLSILAEGAALTQIAKQSSTSRRGEADSRDDGVIAGAVVDAVRLRLDATTDLSLRLSYADPRRAEEVREPLRASLDRRAGEGARVTSAVDGSDVVISIEPSPSTLDVRRPLFDDGWIAAARGAASGGTR